MLMHDLGLDGAPEAEDGSSAEDENELEQASVIEYHALKREMMALDAQRDELLLKVRTLSEKNHDYHDRLTKEEAGHRQQVKILKKTYEGILGDKERLIDNLRAIVAEQDGRLGELEGHQHNGGRAGGTVAVAVARLAEQARLLHSEKFELVAQLHAAQASADEARAEAGRLQAELGHSKQLAGQAQAVQLAMENDSSHLERRIEQLTDEKASLGQQIVELSSKLTAVSAASAAVPRATADRLRRLEEQNDKLMNRVLSLEADCATSAKQLADAEQQHRDQLRAAADERQQLERQASAARSKPPEVVERRVEVQVESEELKRTAMQLRRDNASQGAELQSLKKKLTDATTQLSDVTTKLAASESALKSKQDELAQQRDAGAATVRELQRGRDAASTELLACKKQCIDLSSQLQEASAKLLTHETLLKTRHDELKEVQQSSGRTAADLQRSKDAAVAEASSYKALLSEANGQTRQCRDQIAELEKLLRDRDDELSSARRASELTRAELRQACDAATAELHSVKASSSRTTRQLEAAEQKVAELETLLDSRDKDLHSLRQSSGRELAEARRDRDEAVERLRADAERRTQQAKLSRQTIHARLLVLGPAVRTIAQDFLALKRQCAALAQQVAVGSQAAMRDIAAAVARVSEHNQELVRKYRKEMSLRKKYHNELVELKGNIRVFCRIRPIIREDGEGMGAVSVIEHDQDDEDVIHVSYKGRKQTFDMDKIFGIDSSQTQVFDEVRSLVTSCIDGYNVCIFAYGQTGSGKTFTMEGPTDNPGINQRALAELFDETADRKREWNFSIRISAIEIYNEMLRDLLSADPGSYKLDVKMAQDSSLYVPGLTWVDVSSLDDVNRLFSQARVNRATATTNMNEHSSRSHAVLCIEVTGVNRTTGVKSLGKLNLVDLAGSERVSKSGADGDRLKEAQKINKSLSSLGDVIAALRNKQSFVPYRNSKLTYLLQDSLGGDSKTLMIVQVAPVQFNVSETMCSLAFAQRVRAVELGTASKCLEASTEKSDKSSSRERLDQSDVVQPSTPTKIPVTGRRK